MPTRSYDRYGLTGNPFRDLSSENLSDVDLFHVNLEVDETLRTIREEVYDKENHAVVAVTGEPGSGKTERLLVAQSEAKQRGAFSVYFDVSSKTPLALRGLAEQFHTAATSAGLVKTFSSPNWLKAIAALEKIKDQGYDPMAAGKALGQALNDTSPSFLLLNDLHNLVTTAEANSFAKVLQQLTDAIKPGVLVMFNCYPSYLAWLIVNHPAFATRINRTFALPGLTSEEAKLLIAKKMLPKRLVEDLDPIYPFDAEAVVALNEGTAGNPRRLLELADLSIEYALGQRAYRVDVEVVRAVLTQSNRSAGAGVRQTITSGPPAAGTRAEGAAPPQPLAVASGNPTSANPYRET